MSSEAEAVAAEVRATNPTKDGGGHRRWFPLESNPALMNSYVSKMGFDTSLYEFVDVFSTESWALDMIPQPVAAVIMLYPLSEKQEAFVKDDVLLWEKEGTKNEKTSSAHQDDVWFIKQRIGNACGTIGLLHALLNAPPGLRGVAFSPQSWIHQFAQAVPPMMDPIVKAELLEEDATIERLHDTATSDPTLNQTNRGNIEDRVMTHFIALCHVNGRLLELDGRKTGPVDHGPTTETTLLQDACAVVQTFMSRDPEEVRFTILALAPKQE